MIGESPDGKMIGKWSENDRKMTWALPEPEHDWNMTGKLLENVQKMTGTWLDNDREMSGKEEEQVDRVEETAMEVIHSHQPLVLEYNQHKIQV